MTIRFAAAILLASTAFSQPTLPKQGRMIEIDPAKPRETVATLDGKPVTAEEFQQLIVAMDPKAKEAARNDATEMLRYVGFLRRMGAEAEKRGYIVIAPAAPNGALFFEEGARIFPEFLKGILADYKIEGDKFHIAGPSNGGIGAFHVAAANPQYFVSVTAFPGYLWEPNDAKLQAISKMCVFMYVGENDEYRWHGEMKREVEWLTKHGTVARYTEEKGQPHRMETLAGAGAARLFDNFAETKKGCSK